MSEIVKHILVQHPEFGLGKVIDYERTSSEVLVSFLGFSPVVRVSVDSVEVVDVSDLFYDLNLTQEWSAGDLADYILGKSYKPLKVKGLFK